MRRSKQFSGAIVNGGFGKCCLRWRDRWNRYITTPFKEIYICFSEVNWGSGWSLIVFHVTVLNFFRFVPEWRCTKMPFSVQHVCMHGSGGRNIWRSLRLLELCRHVALSLFLRGRCEFSSQRRIERTRATGAGIDHGVAQPGRERKRKRKMQERMWG